MTAEKIAYSLRDIMTNVADKLGEPVGMMFDTSVLNEIQKEYVGACEALDQEVAELRGELTKLTERLEREVRNLRNRLEKLESGDEESGE